jgi:peptide deformylase
MAKKVKYYEGHLIEYEIYKLIDFYDDRLRKPLPLYEFTDEKSKEFASEIAFSLVSTLEKYEGLGISANQVGLDVRVCAINMGQQIWTMFNPEIIERSEELSTEFTEGCLSYPGLHLKIPRHKRIKVRFQAIGGQFIEQEFTGLTSVCVQHEIDHLNGIVYTSKVSPIKLDQAKRKVKSNLKKMQILAEQFRSQQQALAEQQRMSTKSNEILQKKQEPTISILDTSMLDNKEVTRAPAENFVYRVG